MAAYLIFINILVLGMAGMSYMFSSDILDIIIPVGVGIGYAHADTTYILDILIFLFRWLPVWILIGLVFFDYVMVQKPVRQY